MSKVNQSRLWKQIVQKLEEFINLDDELPPFLHAPAAYLKAMDKDVRQLFEEKLFEILEQPYREKPAKTIADDLMKRLFDGLLHNNLPSNLLKIYYKLTDSDTYRPSLEAYILAYKLDPSVKAESAHPDHCFSALDHKALRILTENLRDKAQTAATLKRLKTRINSVKAKRFVPIWWIDVVTLLEFDSQGLTTCNSLDKVVGFYTTHFSKIDRAIRNLYAVFLQEEMIIRPLQEHYENFNHELLQQWFSHTPQYKSTQQGFLVELIKKSPPNIAIIVGDGVRYEIADYVATALDKPFKVEKHVMLADMPSETEHNMSALYVGNNTVLALHKDREKCLIEATQKDITYLNLEAVHYGIKADYLVLTYKDVDSAGEKLQQGAIKLFSEFEKVLTEKITLLLKMGFREVHLVTDHGFVLTGLLTESDKIDPLSISGKREVHERFIRTVDKQNSDNFIGFNKPYGDYNYVQVSKSHRPFKSKGVYGFSHGGFTPQEIVIPQFVFRKTQAASSGLNVSISNKKDLTNVTGELFSIKLQAAAPSSDLFASHRKVQILLYAANKPYSESQIFPIEANKVQSIEFSFKGNNEVQAVLIDALTQEQLDTVLIKKSNARDLGGLM